MSDQVKAHLTTYPVAMCVNTAYANDTGNYGCIRANRKTIFTDTTLKECPDCHHALVWKRVSKKNVRGKSMSGSNFILTSRGNKFYVDEPERTKFEIEDIVHALSNLCRFGGHVRSFYSVAQHSVLVSRILEKMPGTTPDHWLMGLMHDATEAYMVDVPTPLKKVLIDYEWRETRLMCYLAASLDLPRYFQRDDFQILIHKADQIALVTEARQLLCSGITRWPEELQALQPDDEIIEPWAPPTAKGIFLNRWAWLQQVRGK